MASVTTRPNGHRWVTFKGPNGKRQTLRLGAASEQQANNVKDRVERLLICCKIGEPPSAALIEWLSDLPDNHHDTLANCGATTPRGARTVGDLTTWFRERYKMHVLKGRRKQSTLKNVVRVIDVMDRFFGRDRKLRTFRSYLDTPDESETDGEKFRSWLLTDGKACGGPLAPTTASNLCCRARYVFQKAVDRGWMKANPLGEERNWVTTNPDRDAYITAEQFEQVMKESGTEAQLFFSLIRYGGLRGVSEIEAIELSWIDWLHRTLFVKAPKTAHHGDGHQSRFIPLNNALFKLLLAASENAPAGERFLFGDLRVTNASWDSRLEAACRRAQVIMWPKPKINLRASCEFDWLREHPIDRVAAWMGHSPDTMLKHYNRVVKQQTAQAAGSALHPELDPPQVKQNAKRA